ncbi:abscisic acid receptor PYL11-like [Humulus lupulus]|uniref:abscisic acid receptor PYL11-like n=1 Tax=Humulus lupulus TaxID=3486 RepID=UPI002B40A41B|nr:abscisic acid receptor PYL11-like [Humulus lupulus]
MVQVMKESKAEAMLNKYHFHYSSLQLSSNQCSSSLTQTIDAPMSLVWSLVRRFAYPQVYKQFVKSCSMRSGTGGIGSVREVTIITGLPAEQSVEMLEELDDDTRVMSFRIIGGDHRLANYRSTISVQEEEEEEEEGGAASKTVVVESYVVDVPAGSSVEDTCTFADTIIRCNLSSLARIAQKMAADE